MMACKRRRRETLSVALQSLHNEKAAQMSVELAVVLPVVLIIILLVFNLARYISLAMKFSSACSHVVVNLGITASDEQNAHERTRAVQEQISEIMHLGDTGTVDVRIQQLDRLEAPQTTAQAIFSMLPQFNEFICTMQIRPWPANFVIAGISLSPPAFLRFEYRLVVDPYRCGVLL